VPREKQELIEILQAESTRLERLARDFGDLGRLPEGPTSAVDMKELLAGLAKTAPGTTRVTIEGGGQVQGHYEVLRRAFTNLMLNALDAMQNTGALELTITPRQGTVEITMKDSGPGIPADHVAKLFEPYFTTKTGGTGLGLAIVRQTIHHHGGTITAANAPEGGAVFTIVLPAASA
jgi:signal transduction histidine kinase